MPKYGSSLALAATLAASSPALADKPVADNTELAAVMTAAISRVARLGLKLELAAGNRPGEVIFRNVPDGQTAAVIDAVNATPKMNDMGCVGFVVVPDTNLPPAEYKGPCDMGVYCGPNIPM
ncbi:MAG: hypothetical protein AAB592_04025 [Patescibacteria group bacterium]